MLRHSTASLKSKSLQVDVGIELTAPSVENLLQYISNDHGAYGDQHQVAPGLLPFVAIVMGQLVDKGTRHTRLGDPGRHRLLL